MAYSPMSTFSIIRDLHSWQQETELGDMMHNMMKESLESMIKGDPIVKATQALKAKREFLKTQEPTRATSFDQMNGKAIEAEFKKYSVS